MNHSLFSENMKVADLVLSNYRLLFVLPRFGVGLGMGEHTVRQLCEQKRISASLFLMVCNVYTFNDYLPSKQVINDICQDDLITYLRNSHKDYLEKRVPLIIQEILNVTPTGFRDVLEKFCNKYKAELEEHLNYEEEVVFPYITALSKGNKAPDYNIQTFEKNHSDIEESLNDLKNILIKYVPDSGDFVQDRKVLIDLSLLEEDLNKHTLLEDKILVSLVERMEEAADGKK